MIIISRKDKFIIFALLFLISLTTGCVKNGGEIKKTKNKGFQSAGDMRESLQNMDEGETGDNSTPEELYQFGIAYCQKAEENSAFFRNERYQKALNSFQEVKEKYSYSEYATLAELMMGDCYMGMKNYEEAITAYREFRKLHPTNEYNPHVIFQSGMCYFNQMSSIDRDQTLAHNAIIEFEYLIDNYPGNEYVNQCRENIAICRKGLAERSFYIGEFYFKKKSYSAALRRFNEVLSDYPGLGLDEKARQYISECKSFLNGKE